MILISTIAFLWRRLIERNSISIFQANRYVKIFHWKKDRRPHSVSFFSCFSSQIDDDRRIREKTRKTKMKAENTWHQTPTSFCLTSIWSSFLSLFLWFFIIRWQCLVTELLSIEHLMSSIADGSRLSIQTAKGELVYLVDFRQCSVFLLCIYLCKLIFISRRKWRNIFFFLFLPRSRSFLRESALPTIYSHDWLRRFDQYFSMLWRKNNRRNEHIGSIILFCFVSLIDFSVSFTMNLSIVSDRLLFRLSMDSSRSLNVSNSLISFSALIFEQTAKMRSGGNDGKNFITSSDSIKYLFFPKRTSH